MVVFRLFFVSILLLFLLAQEARAVSLSTPIILEAEKIPQILGQKVGSIQLFQYQREILRPIPWQLDAVNHDGWIELSQKENPFLRVKAKDQILWMAQDMGEQAPKSLLKDAGTFWLELELGQKSDLSKYIYIQLFAQDSQKSSVDYVRYDSQEDFTLTPNYYVGYQDVIIANRLGWMNKDASQGPNQLNRVAVHFRASAFFGLIPIDLTEKSLVSSIIGAKDGTIRGIKRIKSGPKLPFGLRGPSNITEMYFYENYFQTKAHIKFPLGSTMLFKDASFRIYVALAPQPYDIRLTLPENKSFTLSPNMLTGEHVVQQDPPTWIYFHNPKMGRSFAVRIFLAEESRELLQANSLMYTFEGDKIPPQGTIWFEVKITPHSGDHSFDLFFYAPGNGSTPDEMKNLLDLANRPYELRQVTRIDKEKL